MQVSRKLLAALCLAVIVFAALPSFSAAQDDGDVSQQSAGDAGATPEATDDADEYEEDAGEDAQAQMYVMPAPDVQTYVKFLGVTDNKFIAGDEVTALIGMHNAGDKTYNVSYVGAHLHSPYDQSFYVQNFTVRWTSGLLPPKSEVTLEYRFRPDEKLEPLDFHLSGWLIYNDSAPTPIIYRSLFVNHTIEVLERRQPWTVASGLTYALGAAGLAIGAYVIAQQTGLAKPQKKRAAAASNASAESVASSWTPNVYKPASVQKAFGSKIRLQKPPSKK